MAQTEQWVREYHAKCIQKGAPCSVKWPVCPADPAHRQHEQSGEKAPNATKAVTLEDNSDALQAAKAHGYQHLAEVPTGTSHTHILSHPGEGKESLHVGPTGNWMHYGAKGVVQGKDGGSLKSYLDKVHGEIEKPQGEHDESDDQDMKLAKSLGLEADCVKKYITHEGSKWQVHSEAGKVLGTHDSKADAVRQLGAIEANKHPKAKAAPGSKVQSLIFDKEHYKTAQEAKAWAKDHGFTSGKVDETENSFRIRQHDPESFDIRGTIDITQGIKGTVGVPKAALKQLQRAVAEYMNLSKMVLKREDVLAEAIADAEGGSAIYRVALGTEKIYFQVDETGAVALQGYFEKSDFMPVVKKAEQRYTLGPVYAPGEIDFHGDTMTEAELEKAAWAFMQKDGVGSRVGLMHRPGTGGAGKVVESYIYRGPEWKIASKDGDPEQNIPTGTWMLGTIWNEDAWNAIKSGALKGYSLQGVARKHAVA